VAAPVVKKVPLRQVSPHEDKLAKTFVRQLISDTADLRYPSDISPKRLRTDAVSQTMDD
jgi:hypothetical protein